MLQLKKKSIYDVGINDLIKILFINFFCSIEIHDEMFQIEVEIFKVRSKIKQWTKYRDIIRLEEQRAIQSLERELAYMIDNYVVLSSREEFFFFN